jgi:hypothetical protein
VGDNRVEILDLNLGVTAEIVFGHLEKDFYIPALSIDTHHILLRKRKISA